MCIKNMHRYALAAIIIVILYIAHRWYSVRGTVITITMPRNATYTPKNSIIIMENMNKVTPVTVAVNGNNINPNDQLTLVVGDRMSYNLGAVDVPLSRIINLDMAGGRVALTNSGGNVVNSGIIKGDGTFFF